MSTADLDRVLIVDDNLDIQRVYSKLFSDAGYGVYTATNLAETEGIVRDTHPDLILLDVMLGDEDGFDVLQRIRQSDGDTYTFVVMITGKKTSPDDKASGLERGADGYVARPVENRELLARVAAFMRHKRTIDNLRRSEAQFKRIIERNPDALLVVNRHGRVEFANPAAEDLFRKARDELVDEVFGFPIVTDGCTEIKVVRDGEHAEAEMRTIDIVWNDRDCFLTSVRDLSERRQIEAALRDREARFRVSFEHSQVGMAILSLDGGFQEVNHRTVDILGYSKDDLFKMTILDITHPDDVEAVAGRYQGMINSADDECSIDNRYLHKDGHTIHGILSASLVRDAENDPRYVVAQLVDTSAQRRAEQAEQEAVRERAGYADEMRKLARHLQDAREEQSAHVAREIHDDLGQLLTATEMNLAHVTHRLAELPESKIRVDLDSSVVQARKAISAAIDSTRRLINTLRPAVLDTFGVIGAIEYLVEDHNRASGPRFKLEIPDDEVSVDEYRGLVLFRFVQEAMTNVTRHSGASQASVSVQVFDDTIVAEVSDNGVGFDPGDSTAGFGLIGMRERAMTCSGEVTITTRPGDGVTVRLSLPLLSSPNRRRNESGSSSAK